MVKQGQIGRQQLFTDIREYSGLSFELWAEVYRSQRAPTCILLLPDQHNRCAGSTDPDRGDVTTQGKRLITKVRCLDQEKKT